MQKKFTTQSQKNQFIQKWQDSGLSQKAFSQQIGISYATFHLWVKKYKQEINSAIPAFVPLSVEATHFKKSNSTGNKIEIHTNSGLSITFSYQPDPAYLQNLLRL